MDINCPGCKVPFSPTHKPSFPRVLPCGHSVCTVCLGESLNSWSSYYCTQCSQKIQFDNGAMIPLNQLYFQMMQKIQMFLRQRKWEHQQRGNQSYAHSEIVKLEQQCLYTFCQKKKFEMNGVLEMFCSQECKKNHEELQVWE